MIVSKAVGASLTTLSCPCHVVTQNKTDKYFWPPKIVLKPSQTRYFVCEMILQWYWGRQWRNIFAVDKTKMRQKPQNIARRLRQNISGTRLTVFSNKFCIKSPHSRKMVHKFEFFKMSRSGFARTRFNVFVFIGPNHFLY